MGEKERAGENDIGESPGGPGGGVGLDININKIINIQL